MNAKVPRNRLIAAILTGLCLTTIGTMGAVIPARAGTPPPSNGAPPLGRMVWVHMMGQMPIDARMQYGATYPIALRNPAEPVDQATTTREMVDNLRHSGIGGIAFEIVPGKETRAPGVPQYASLVQTLAGSGLPVAPCIDSNKSPDEIIEAIEQSYVAAKKYGNPAIMADGRLIVFLYDGKRLSPAQWTQVRNKVKADGFSLYLAGDVAQANMPPAKLLGNAGAMVGSWDAAFNFPPLGMAGDGNSNLNFQKVMIPQGKMWIGSIMAGYYRGISVDPVWGPFGTDPLGTRRLRSIWQDILSSDMGWVYWVTQNDFIEHTNLAPDSAWGYTKSDINLWYASRLTGSTYPFGKALYLTTPQTLHAGEKSVVELAVINPEAQAMTFHLQLIADNGDRLGAADLKVAAHQLDAVQIPVTGPIGGRYRYARATATGPTGTTQSAPILLSAQPRLPQDHGTINYYSLSSRHATPKGLRPTIAVQGSEVRITGIDPNTVLSADLLADGNLVDQIKFPTATWPAAIILNQGKVLRFDRDTNDNKNSRLYRGPAPLLVRIVMKNGSIWFSAPLPASATLPHP